MSTLKKIVIKNYRSIEHLEINIPVRNSESNCFGLVGINEAGKSSILKAIALKDNINVISVSLSDFKNDTIPIVIEYKYELQNVVQELRQILGDVISEKDVLRLHSFSAHYTINNSNLNLVNEELLFDQTILEDLTDNGIIEKIATLYKGKIHETVFWTSDEKYLINKPIPLSSFIKNPESISVPLFNCFKLAGIDDISTAINKALVDPADRDYLEERLGSAVTEHVKDTWRNELIEIKLKINENVLNFLVKDLAGTSKSKTVDQRSDGFKQFISFLLTVSAESKRENLLNTILLIDEPETHLHPIAQGNLLDELINISRIEFNNISFFATHSNYLISKNNLGNYFHVKKPGDSSQIQQFIEKHTDYAEVNYLVFGIVSTDYHNVLYGKLLSEIEGQAKELDKYLKDTLKKKYVEKDYIMQNSDGTKLKPMKVSLQTYIRHLIHHPENQNNELYSENELKSSVEIMIKVLAEISK
jgi:predicted ATP-dependent endonuclease of OLD family